METSSTETLPMETSQMESSLMDTLQTDTGHSAKHFLICNFGVLNLLVN